MAKFPRFFDDERHKNNSDFMWRYIRFLEHLGHSVRVKHDVYTKGYWVYIKE